MRPLAPASHPRDLRLAQVAHLLPPVALTGLLATLAAPEATSPAEALVVDGVRLGLIGLFGVYLMVLGAVRSGHHEAGRLLLLSAWTVYPGSLLLLHRPGLPMSPVIALWAVSLTMTGLVAMGAVALDRSRRVAPWTLGVLLCTATAGLWSAGSNPGLDRVVVGTGLGMSTVLLLVGVATLRAVVEQLEDHVDAVDRQAREAEATRRAMQQAMQRALASDLAKSRFLANMSHELRTPLTAIIGYAELAREEVEDDGAADPADLARIEGAGRHLLGVVDAILDLSRVEHGRIEVRAAAFAPRDPLQAAADTVRPLARERGLELRVDLDHAPPTAVSDPALLRQVLINLATNAVRYTAEGSVTLVGAADGDAVLYSVVDTGPGIADAEMPRLFEAFERGASDDAVRSGGVGLGLAITRSLCEALGATLAVHTVEGEGTTFTVRVPPLKPVPPPAR